MTGAPFIIERVPPSADAAAAKDQQRFELSERVRKQELFGFLEIGADVIAYGKTPAPVPAPTSERRRRPRPTGVPDQLALRYQSNTPTYQAFSSLRSGYSRGRGVCQGAKGQRGKGAE